MRLLVVDDQESIGMIVSQVAQHGGWESSFISDAKLAVETVASYEPHVLLIDRFMPGVSGPEIVAELRQKGYTFPVILFSGDTADIDPAEIEKLGITAVLTKPISLKELRAWLNKFAKPAE
jgi:DNA-binding response OmpR family regulator